MNVECGMWSPPYSFSGNISFEISVFCLCSAGQSNLVRRYLQSYKKQRRHLKICVPSAIHILVQCPGLPPSIQSYHFQADLILCDGTFKSSKKKFYNASFMSYLFIKLQSVTSKRIPNIFLPKSGMLCIRDLILEKGGRALRNKGRQIR